MHYEQNGEGKNIASLSGTHSEYAYVRGRMHIEVKNDRLMHTGKKCL